MRVPETSVIAKTFAGGGEFEPHGANENLNSWRTSSGEELENIRVRVEAMKVRDEVWVIVTPA